MKREDLGKFLFVFSIFVLQVGYSSAESPPGPFSQIETTTEPALKPTADICPPYYREPEKILDLNLPSEIIGMVTADFNNDSLPDVLVPTIFDQQQKRADLVILLNDGKGGLIKGNSQIFTGGTPTVINATEIIISDFNGDKRTDIFIADFGMDKPPIPGAKNPLVLSTSENKMTEASNLWPDIFDSSHSATAADIDGDGDVDLYVGNIWGETHEQPAIFVNTDGKGTFSEAKGRLPFPLEDIDFGAFTASRFVDVNNDDSPDLILGDAGDELSGGIESYVLLNNGSGYFSFLENAIPKKPWSESDLVLDIQAADINNDGFQDLLFVYTKQEYYSWYLQVLLNNQDGTFRDETQARLPQSGIGEPWMIGVKFIDLDNDGGLDVATFPSVGNTNAHFFLNNGGGFFTEIDNPFNFKAEFYTFIDIDQDGYLDVVWGKNYPDYSFYINRSLGCETLGD